MKFKLNDDFKERNWVIEWLRYFECIIFIFVIKKSKGKNKNEIKRNDRSFVVVRYTNAARPTTERL